MWTLRELKVRYKQSYLGAAWAILQPLALMIVFTIVFSQFAKVPTDGIPYPLFSYVAVLPWTFLAVSLSLGVSSLVNNIALVTKVKFPREILPLGTIFASFVDLLIASLVFVGLLVFYRESIYPTVVWIPLLLLVQIILVVGIVLPISALNVSYRDFRFVVPLLLQLWLYASPVIYPTSAVPERWQVLYMLNPMAGLIESYRRVLLKGLPPDALHLGTAAIIAVLLLISGYIYFKRSEATFADII